MTNPFQVSPGGVIQDPGIGGTLASSLAQVLAQQQLQRENQFRVQQLQQQAAQQQALEQYYQGQNANEAGRIDLARQQDQAKMAGQAQVGGAVRRAITPPAPMAPPQASSATASMQPAMGQQSQSPLQDALRGGAQAIGGQAGMASIFSGVQDQNLQAAVEAVQGLQPKPEEAPTSAKEYSHLQYLKAIDPTGRLAQGYEIWHRQQQPTTNVNIGDKAETAYAVETSKADVARQDDQFKQATTASNAFPSLKEAYGLIDKSSTGFGSKQILGLNRVLSSMGVKVAADKATDTQTLSKLLRDGVLAQLQTRALGSGTAVSDADRNYMEQVQGADLTQEPGAIKRIIRINIGLGIEKMVTAKMEYEQALQDHPESAGTIKGKIRLLDNRLGPIFKQYQKMLGDETAAEAQSRMTAGPQADQLFPAR